jgi:hypothetical protein
MSSQFNRRQRRQHSSYERGSGGFESSATAVPVREQRGMAMKAGALAAGTVVAGTALIGGTSMGPAVFGTPSASVQRDIALTTGGTTTTDAFNLAGLLDSISIDVNGTEQPLGTSTLSQLVEAFPQANLTLGTLLGDLGLTNGLNTTLPQLLDALNVGSLEPINALLATVPVATGDSPLTGASTIGNLLADATVSFGGQTTTIGDITVDDLLATIAVPSGDSPLSDATTLSQLLTDFPALGDITLPPIHLLGGTIDVTGDLSNLVSDLGLGGDTLGQLGGFTSTTDISDLATSLGIADTSVNSLLADLGSAHGVTLSGTSTLDNIVTFLGQGDTTLGSLIPGDLTNSSTLSDLLGDSALLGTAATDNIDTLLGSL